ncbi:MAG: carboxypeptidase-like regulatory domain-containing protein, partial [Planctomycetes bacterium]|nr:carboxypeptidase-like regulatory domain-containing protein [Planctomycetota bacterium]
KVSLVNAFTGAVLFTAQTDATGSVTLSSLPEGPYELYVTAAEHDTSRGSVLIEPGRTKEQLVFLRSQLVTYSWNVVPVPFEDRYSVVVESQFQTNVPAPVILVEPGQIDLAEITDGFEQIDFKISNQGLIAATDVRLEFPSHPLWEIVPLIDVIDVLPAKSEMIIPVIVQRKAFGGATGSEMQTLADTGPCTITATIKWIVLCGPFGINYSVPIPIINASGNCGPTPGGGGWGGGGSWGGGYIGPGISGPKWKYSPPEKCDCDPDSTSKFTIDVSGFASAGAKALSTAISAIDLGPVSIDANVGKVTGLATIETCCKADDSTGLKITGSGTVSGKVELKYYLVGGELSKEWSDGVYNYSFTAGAGIPITASAELKGGVEVTKECEGDLKICAFAGLSLGVSVGPTIEGKLEMTQIVTGQTWSLGASASATLQTGVSGEVRWCTGEGLTGKVCFDGLKFVAQISASGGPVGVSYSFERTIVEQSCYPAANGSAVLASLLESSGPLTDDEIALLAGFRSRDELLGALGVEPAPASSDGSSEPAETAAPTGNDGTTCTTCGCGLIGPLASDGVCATVRLRLEQEVTMTRTAFEGTLDINNRAGDPIEDLQVFISVTDTTTGEPANDRFAFSAPVLANVLIDRQTDDGVWYVIPPSSRGSLVWTLLPTDEAAPEGPTEYTVGGLMTYMLAGREYSVPLFPAPITVYPDAALYLKYFHQRDVFSDDPFTEEIEPSIPYDLGILITNEGKGAAHNLKIVSAQPQIIENEKGLLIDFEIVGAEVDGQPSPHALTTNFGEVGPDETHEGRWQLVSSLQGHFVEYTASFEHLTGFGDSRTSLIKSVEIYELIHTVLDARAGADAL